MSSSTLSGVDAGGPAPDQATSDTTALWDHRSVADEVELRVAVLSDTHLRGGIERLPTAAVAEIERSDVVLHAGDVLDRGALGALRELAGPRSFHAVLGNNDHELVGSLPDRLEVELAGVLVAMVHDTGARTGREARMRRWFPTAAVVVFGHSHEPWAAPGTPGQLLFNPGSAVQRRRQPHHTMGVLELGGGRVLDRRIVVVDSP
jgi:putative phosphoesterase